MKKILSPVLGLALVLGSASFVATANDTPEKHDKKEEPKDHKTDHAPDHKPEHPPEHK